MTDVLTAAAALAAAGASVVTLVITLVITGRREHTRWVRETLAAAFVAFLDASWRGTHAAGLRLAEIPAEDGAEQQAYDDLRTQLTRLRLLASAGVSEAGLELVRCHYALSRADQASVADVLSDTRASRTRFLEIARREMRLR